MASDATQSAGERDIVRLLPRHFKMVEMVLAGLPTKDIATALELHPNSVSIITNSPIFQDEVARRRASQQRRHDDLTVGELVRARAVLEENATRAAETQVELLGAEDDSVRLRSASAILDRVFGPAGGAATSNTRVTVIGDSAIANLRAALRESGLIDAPATVASVEISSV